MKINFWIFLICLCFSCAKIEPLNEADLIATGWTYGAKRNIIRDGGNLFLLPDGNVLLVGGLQYQGQEQISAPVEKYITKEKRWEIISTSFLPQKSKDIEYLQIFDGIIGWDSSSKTLFVYSFSSNEWKQSVRPILQHSSLSRITFWDYFNKEVLLYGDSERMEIYNANTQTWRTLPVSSGLATAVIQTGFLTKELLFLGNTFRPNEFLKWNTSTNETTLIPISFKNPRTNYKVASLSSNTYLIYGDFISEVGAIPQTPDPEILNLNDFSTSQTVSPIAPKNKYSIGLNQSFMENDLLTSTVVFFGGREFRSITSTAMFNRKYLVVERFEPENKEWKQIGLMADECAAAVRLADNSVLILRNNSTVTEIIENEALIQ